MLSWAPKLQMIKKIEDIEQQAKIQITFLEMQPFMNNMAVEVSNLLNLRVSLIKQALSMFNKLTSLENINFLFNGLENKFYEFQELETLEAHVLGLLTEKTRKDLEGCFDALVKKLGNGFINHELVMEISGDLQNITQISSFDLQKQHVIRSDTYTKLPQKLKTLLDDLTKSNIENFINKTNGILRSVFIELQFSPEAIDHIVKVWDEIQKENAIATKKIVESAAMHLSIESLEKLIQIGESLKPIRPIRAIPRRIPNLEDRQLQQAIENSLSDCQKNVNNTEKAVYADWGDDDEDMALAIQRSLGFDDKKIYNEKENEKNAMCSIDSYDPIMSINPEEIEREIQFEKSRAYTPSRKNNNNNNNNYNSYNNNDNRVIYVDNNSLSSMVSNMSVEEAESIRKHELSMLGYDEEMDPELAEALRLSMLTEEEMKRESDANISDNEEKSTKSKRY